MLLTQFVNEHIDDDPVTLLLQKGKYPDVDIEQAVRQIEGKRQAATKWPSLVCCDNFLFPPRLNREQASSEATANFKREIVKDVYRTVAGSPLRIADLTGGMGIDSIALARIEGSTVDYVERNEELCRLTEHNVAALGMENIRCHCKDCMQWLEEQKEHYDILFVDPARRDSHGRKVAAFEDCTPNILENMPLLRSHCHKLLVKASPMTDIDKALMQLRDVSDIFIVAVKGECKELLFLCGENQQEPLLHSRDLPEGQGMDFLRSEEKRSEAVFCKEVGRYLYEPNAALMKAGPYKMICHAWNVKKLSQNTHLYTSDSHIEHFPGRTLEVLQEVSLNRKAVAAAIPEGKAHVATRNYPTAAAELQKQLGLSEGGELYVIATTTGSKKTGYICRQPKNY